MNNYNIDIFDEMSSIDEAVRIQWMGIINGNYYSEKDVDILLNKKPVFIEQQVGAGQLNLLKSLILNDLSSKFNLMGLDKVDPKNLLMTIDCQLLSNQELLLPTFRSGDVVVGYSETISSLIDFLSNEGIGNVGGINHNVIIESPSALSEYNRDILIEIFKFGKLPNGKTFNKRGVKVIIVDDNKDFYSMF
jgi:hypothetical protein